ncbi:MAG: hypothetical protein WC809_19135 [Sinimarinibacterium sp.]|jgi:hypothetical protein
MTLTSKRIGILVAGLMWAVSPVTFAQPADPAAEPGKVVITIIHAAPGKQLDLLKWLAAREEVDKEAGVPATQLYAHMDGDSWDYLTIAPQLSEADSNKVDELTKKKGMKIGFPAGLEYRQFVTTHTDTFARGPMTAADLVKMAKGK